MSSRVLLTGGNGFIGSHILFKLLDSGHDVCCAVRTPEKGDKILQDFANQIDQISITIVPDIVAPNAYSQAVEGSPPYDFVIHAASPFTYQNVQSNLEFLEPAIKEADWNPTTWEEALHGEPSKAYRASKLFAEREAWNFMKQERPHYDLVTLCPPATFGPLRHSISSISDLNESNSRLWKLCFNSTSTAPIPYMPVHTYIDVRDLADAQVRALLVPGAGNQRFLVCARQFDFQQICDILRARFPDLVDRTPLGKPGTSSLPKGAYSIDNSKVKEVFAIEFRGLEDTVVDAARFMLDLERSES